MAMTKLFVYGTLKQGRGNNRHYLNDAKFLGYAKTDRDIWGLVDMGAFPAMTYGEFQVEGEVYEVNDEQLSRIDRLEGVDSGLYTRHTIVIDIDGDLHDCEAYLMMGIIQRYGRKQTASW